MGAEFDNCWNAHGSEFAMYVEVGYGLLDDSALNYASDLAIDDEGNDSYVYITDTGAHATEAFWRSPQGEWQSSTGADDDRRADRLAKYDSEGNLEGAWSAFLDGSTGEEITLTGPSGVSMGGDGYLYVSESNGTRILKLDPSNLVASNVVPSAVSVWDTLPECGDRWLEVDAQGNIYTLHPGDDLHPPGIAKYSESMESVSAGSKASGTASVTVTTENPSAQTFDGTSEPLLGDTDLDGLEDAEELTRGTDPTNPDTDGDGIGDSWEVKGGTDPNNQDTDGDGLPDAEEIAYGSDPTAISGGDTDGDGLTDLDEFNRGSDPANNDTDGDGLNDGSEPEGDTDADGMPNVLDLDADGDLLLDGEEDQNSDGVVDVGETDPLNPDTDGDRIDDGIETVHSTNPLEADTDDDGIEDMVEVEERLSPVSDDTDNDGISDGKELNTNPWLEDSDFDGRWDGEEDLNDNGVVDAGETDPLDPDTDVDGVPDGIDESPADGTKRCGVEVLEEIDSDNDGIPDCIDGCLDDPHKASPGICGCQKADTDADGDGIEDCIDACTDTDADGFGNPSHPGNTCAVDNCPETPNAGQGDADGDGTGDACDACTDIDADGSGNPGYPVNTCAVDNCPVTHNADQADADGDGSGDACDTCTDSDADGYGNFGYPTNTCATDNCPVTFNPDQGDADTDGGGDACDPCPLDPDNDTDADTVCGDVDNCVTTYNPDQGDADTDDSGDACDVCPLDPDDDADADTECGDLDNCVTTYNPEQSDADADDSGDACDTCTDTDADGYGNPGYPANTCASDNCPITANPDQGDADIDDMGDACDACPLDPDNDADADSVCGNVDNCQATYNPDQANFDGDETGDACDPDDDNDAVVDEDDQCKEENASGFDADSDGCIDTLTGLAGLVETLVSEGVIDETIKNSILSKMANAQKSADKENICAAANQLHASQNEVDAHRGKKISDTAASLVIAYVDNVIAGLLSRLPDGESC